MSLVLLFHCLLLNMFRMLVHPSSGACDLLWIYFLCCIALVRCVLVLRCGSAGVVWYPYAGWGTSASACIRIPHHPSRTTPYRQHTSNQNSIPTHRRKLLKMNVLAFEMMLWKKIKQVTSVGLSLVNYQYDARSNKHKMFIILIILIY